MYEWIEGRLVEKQPLYAVVEAGGIGYRIYCPVHRLPPLGLSLRLYLSHVVRETSQVLYGFLERAERELFELLIGLSGVGPKTGLSLLSSLHPAEFEEAVLRGDTKRLCSVPGVGKKMAERLTLELKGKLTGQFLASAPNPLLRDAQLVLVNLGYKEIEAITLVEKALKEAPEQVELSELLALILRSK